MLQSLDDLLGLIGRLYPEGTAPKPFLLLHGVKRVKAGEDARQVARSVRSTRKRLEALAATADPIEGLFGCNLASAAEAAAMRRPQEMIGQLLLGELAERAFERIYKETMGTNELILEDAREARNETDYRVLNGQRRPVFRINIKFYGTLFRNARETLPVSHYTRDLVARSCGVPCDSMRVIFNGVRPEDFVPGPRPADLVARHSLEGRTVFLTVTRFDENGHRSRQGHDSDTAFG